MKLQLTTIATASLLFTSLVGFFPSNASASFIVAQNDCPEGYTKNADGVCVDADGNPPPQE